MKERHMSRTEAERRIRDLLVEIGKISKEYGTRNYLSLSIDTGDGYVSFFNDYWEDGDDFDNPISYCEFDIDFEEE